MFSWFFCVFKKSVIRRGGFQKSKISDVPILYIISTLRLERLYESYGIRPWGRSTFPGASPPAGPPKIRNIEISCMHPKIFVKFTWLGSGRTRAKNTSESIHSPDLNLVQSLRDKFSRTSRFQNLKLHAFILNLTASRENRSTGSRDIFIFVK